MSNNNQKIEFVAQPLNIEGGAASSHLLTKTVYSILKNKQLDSAAGVEYSWDELSSYVDTPRVPYFHEENGKNEVTFDEYVKFLKELAKHNQDENAEVYLKSYVGTEFYNGMMSQLKGFEQEPMVANLNGSKFEYALRIGVPDIQWIIKDGNTGKVVSKSENRGRRSTLLKIDADDTAKIIIMKNALQNAINSSVDPTNYFEMRNKLGYADDSYMKDMFDIVSGRDD